MTIEVAPTLELMADIYRRPRHGGAGSDRFTAYVDAGRARLPVHGYNPMTSQPVLDTIEALIAVSAEDQLREVANDTAQRLGVDRDDVMHFTVATPGMWTDRLATEVEHRFLGQDPGGVLWWFDQTVDPTELRAEIAAQTVRLAMQRRYGPPSTLADAVRQEGRAGNYRGEVGCVHSAAAEAFEVLADDASLATQVGFLYGDRAASALGFTTVGLDGRSGYEHAVALAGADPLWTAAG